MKLNCKVFLHLHHLPCSPLSPFFKGVADMVTLWSFNHDAHKLPTSVQIDNPKILLSLTTLIPPGMSPSPFICTHPCSNPQLSFNNSAAASYLIPSPTPAWYLCTLMGLNQSRGWDEHLYTQQNNLLSIFLCNIFSNPRALFYHF